MPSMRATRRTTSPVRSRAAQHAGLAPLRNLWFVIHEKRARKLHKLLGGRVKSPLSVAAARHLHLGNWTSLRDAGAGAHQPPRPFVRGVSVTGVWGGRGAAARISRQKKIGCASSVPRWTGLNMKSYGSSAAHAGANGLVLFIRAAARRPSGRRAALMSGSALIALAASSSVAMAECQSGATGGGSFESQTPRIAKPPPPARFDRSGRRRESNRERRAQPSVPGRKQPQRGPQRLAYLESIR